LCEAYGWTWKELQETPHYVRVIFAQIQSIKNAKKNQESEKALKGV
jgi:hypothetical protein